MSFQNMSVGYQKLCLSDKKARQKQFTVKFGKRTLKISGIATTIIEGWGTYSYIRVGSKEIDCAEDEYERQHLSCRFAKSLLKIDVGLDKKLQYSRTAWTVS